MTRQSARVFLFCFSMQNMVIETRNIWKSSRIWQLISSACVCMTMWACAMQCVNVTMRSPVISKRVFMRLCLPGSIAFNEKLALLLHTNTHSHASMHIVVWCLFWNECYFSFAKRYKRKPKANKLHIDWKHTFHELSIVVCCCGFIFQLSRQNESMRT